jgi:flagellar biosynthesis/type III secretory pathway protein FliH
VKVGPKTPVLDREIKELEEKLSLREHEILDELDRLGYDRGYSQGYKEGFDDGIAYRQRNGFKHSPDFRSWLA